LSTLLPIRKLLTPGGRALLGGAGNLSWVQPGAIIDELFTTGQFFPRPIATELVDTRSTTKTVTNASGLLSTVAINALPTSNAGMLIEPTATNLVTQSGDLSNAAWATFISGSGTLSIVGGQGVAPDGVSQWSKITINRTSTADFAQRNVSFTGTAAAYSGGFYVQAFAAGDIGKTITVALFNGSTSTSTNFTVTLTGGIQRIVAPNVTLAAASCQVIVGYNGGDSAGTGTVNFLCGCAQAELGVGLSSYIPTTTAAATRAADAAVIQRTGIGRVVFTFDDNSQQTISGINTAAQFTIPTNLNRPLIKRMTGFAGGSGTFVPSLNFSDGRNSQYLAIGII
jgi:hypothetical protein